MLAKTAGVMVKTFIVLVLLVLAVILKSIDSWTPSFNHARIFVRRPPLRQHLKMCLEKEGGEDNSMKELVQKARQEDGEWLDRVVGSSLVDAMIAEDNRGIETETATATASTTNADEAANKMKTNDAILFALGYSTQEVKILKDSIVDVIISRKVKRPSGSIPQAWLIPDGEGIGSNVAASNERIRTTQNQRIRKDVVRSPKRRKDSYNDSEFEGPRISKRQMDARASEIGRSLGTDVSGGAVDPESSFSWKTSGGSSSASRGFRNSGSQKTRTSGGDNSNRSNRRRRFSADDDGANAQYRRQLSKSMINVDPDDNSPTPFWPTKKEFQDMLLDESVWRINILGDWVTPLVKSETRWRNEVYNTWMNFLDEGIGDGFDAVLDEEGFGNSYGDDRRDPRYSGDRRPQPRVSVSRTPPDLWSGGAGGYGREGQLQSNRGKTKRVRRSVQYNDDVPYEDLDRKNRKNNRSSYEFRDIDEPSSQEIEKDALDSKSTEISESAKSRRAYKGEYTTVDDKLRQSDRAPITDADIPRDESRRYRNVNSINEYREPPSRNGRADQTDYVGDRRYERENVVRQRGSPSIKRGNSDRVKARNYEKSLSERINRDVDTGNNDLGVKDRSANGDGDDNNDGDEWSDVRDEESSSVRNLREGNAVIQDALLQNTPVGRVVSAIGDGISRDRYGDDYYNEYYEDDRFQNRLPPPRRRQYREYREDVSTVYTGKFDDRGREIVRYRAMPENSRRRDSGDDYFNERMDISSDDLKAKGWFYDEDDEIFDSEEYMADGLDEDIGLYSQGAPSNEYVDELDEIDSDRASVPPTVRGTSRSMKSNDKDEFDRAWQASANRDPLDDDNYDVDGDGDGSRYQE